MGNLAWTANDWVCFFIPGCYPFKGNIHSPEDAILSKQQAKEAEAFFNQLDKQIEASKQTEKSLSTFTDPKNSGSTRLHYAIQMFGKLRKDEAIYKNNEKNARKAIQTLIREESELIYSTNHAQQTPLHLLAVHGTLELVEQFFTEFNRIKGSNNGLKERNLAHDQDEQGRTPLHMAALRNEQAIAKYLINEQKADPNAYDYEGKAPLHYAAKEYVPWIRLLHEQTDISKNPFKTSSEKPKIWEKAFIKDSQDKQWNKKGTASASVWDLNPKYCLLSATIIQSYEELHEKLEKNTLTLDALERNETLRYTLIALPPLLNEMLQDKVNRDILEKLLAQEKNSRLACLALHNSNFIDHLFKEDNLKQLTQLSKKHPHFAMQIFKKHIQCIENCGEENKGRYLSNIAAKYDVAEQNIDVIYKAIANKLALSEIQKLVGSDKSTITSLRDLKKLASVLYATLFEKNTPLHSAVKYDSVDVMDALLQLEGANKWVNKKDKNNQSPLDIYIKAKRPNIAIINNLYSKTSDPEIFKAYLPNDALIEKKSLAAIKACINSNPYHLTHSLINQKCQHTYETLKAKIDSAKQEDRVNVLLSELQKDPLQMFVGMQSSIFEKYVIAILNNSNHTQTLLNALKKYQEEIGMSNAEQIALLIFKKGLSYQKDISLKKQFLKTILKACSLLFPQVAFYAMDQQSHLLSENNIKKMSQYYLLQHHLNRLKLKYPDEEKYLKARLKDTHAILEKHVEASKHRTKILYKYIQISNIKNVKDTKKHIHSLLRYMIKTTGDVDEGLYILNPKVEKNYYGEKHIDHFLDLLQEIIPTHKQSLFVQSINIDKTHDYKGPQDNTFLHIAAVKDNAALAIIERCLEDERVKDILKSLCDSSNSRGKTPLELALEAKNIATIDLLIQHTHDISVWRNAFQNPIDAKLDLGGFKSELDNNFDNIKPTYRLLHENYRDGFRSCIKTINTSQNSQALLENLCYTLKNNSYAFYLLIDCPYLLECLLNASDKNYNITAIFDSHKKGSIIAEKALLEALHSTQHAETFKSPLLCSKLPTQYKVSATDSTGNIEELKKAIKDSIRQQAQQSNSPPRP